MQKIFLLILFVIVENTPILTQHTLQIYGNASFGYYYVKLFVGQPPQEQTVIIDTGSGQLAIPCNKCKDCSQKHLNRPFDMSKSKTAQYVTCSSSDSQCKQCASKSPTQSCKFSISYAQGSSLQGIIIQDSIQFQSLSSDQQITTSFGCTTKETKLFLTQQANGIFGLAPERTSNMLEMLYEKHNIYSGEKLQFSLCLARDGGVMTIGNVNPGLHVTNKSVKTTFSTRRNLYSLDNVKDIKIGSTIIRGKDEPFGYYGIFIDSGSTFTYFPRKNYQTFKKSLIQRCSQHHQSCMVAKGQQTFCFKISGSSSLLSQIQQIFPAIQIQIGTQSIFWHPQRYFLLRDRSNRQVCLGIQPLDRFLLGANWMVQRDVLFNIKEKTIEIFTEVDCHGKELVRREMSQFTDKVDGHKPLTYQKTNPFQPTKSNIKIFIGVTLIIFGVAGLTILCLKRYVRQYKRIENSAESQNELVFV